MNKETLKRYNTLLEHSFVKPTHFESKDNFIVEEDEDELDFEEEDIDLDGKQDSEMEIDDENMDDMSDMDSEFEEETDEIGVEEKPEVDNELDADIEQDEDGDLEIDVTELVNNTEEAKQKVDSVNDKLDKLIGVIDKVVHKQDNDDATINNQINQLRDEIITRNPSKVEKLEMQSLHSAPYDIKLQDYWSSKEGYATDAPNASKPTFEYPVFGQGVEVETDKPKEYLIHQKDIDNAYSDSLIKTSFDDFEEEDVDDY